MDSKGKQKASPGSAASRLEASTKMVVNAITSSREMPALASESKSSSSSGGQASLSGIAGEPSSYSSHQQLLLEQKRTAANQCQNDLYDSFTKSYTDVLATDGYHADNAASSFSLQEASDGLEVSNLLRHLEAESLSEVFGQEHGLRGSGDGDPWREAAVGTADYPACPGDQVDFTPDFISRSELSEQAASYLGTDDSQETSRTWFGYWGEVFATYNARVWGNAPLPSSGRNLQQEHGSTEPTMVGRALSRLKQILYHLK